MSGPDGPDRLPERQADSRRDVLGCSRRRKERLDNLENQDRDNRTEPRSFTNKKRRNAKKTPLRFVAWSVCAKNRREALDAKGSFRDRVPKNDPFFGTPLAVPYQTVPPSNLGRWEVAWQRGPHGRPIKATICNTVFRRDYLCPCQLAGRIFSPQLFSALERRRG